MLIPQLFRRFLDFHRQQSDVIVGTCLGLDRQLSNAVRIDTRKYIHLISRSAATNDVDKERLRAELERCHPISVLLQHDAVRESLQKRFTTQGRILFAARLGYPIVEFEPAPRRPLDACLTTSA